jgi:AcrR family transcriptional regulator
MAEDVQDRRTARTRGAILSAFIALVLERRYETIRVGDIVDKADVGRSTFYEHFRSKDDLLRQSMDGLLGIVADAVLPGSDEARLSFAVAHFWENRRLARAVLGLPLGASVRRQLESLIEERLAGERELARARAVQIAAAQLALLEAWTRGELSASEGRIAERLRAASML